MSRKQRFGIQFVALLIAGLIIFLLTKIPIAGAILPGVRAGWNSLSTGIWILRTDERRGRGRICAAFCLAVAFWKAAAVAFISVLAFIAMLYVFGDDPDMDRFAATMLMLAGGVTVTAVIGLAASVAAATIHIRVWIHPRLREMTDDKLRALEELPLRPGFNHAVFVLATSLAVPPLAICAFCLIEFVSMQFTLAILFFGPFLAVTGYMWLSSRILATHPAECWT